MLRRFMTRVAASGVLGPVGRGMHEKLIRALDPIVLELDDQTEKHRGHAGAPKDRVETHFFLTVVAAKFNGLTLLRRHRLVYEALHEEMEEHVHALRILAMTPDEWEDYSPSDFDLS